MQTQLTFSEKVEQFEKIKIDINGPKISDVIIVWNTDFNKKYHNLMTCKESSNLSEVIRDRRFVLIMEKEFEINRLSGYYVFADEKLDIIGLVVTEMCVTLTQKAKWEETERHFISDSSQSYGKALSLEGGSFDICGQTMIADTSVDNGDYVTTNVGAKRLFSLI